jgi:hypothetical protein
MAHLFHNLFKSFFNNKPVLSLVYSGHTHRGLGQLSPAGVPELHTNQILEPEVIRYNLYTTWRKIYNFLESVSFIRWCKLPSHHALPRDGSELLCGPPRRYLIYFHFSLRPSALVSLAQLRIVHDL